GRGRGEFPENSSPVGGVQVDPDKDAIGPAKSPGHFGQLREAGRRLLLPGGGIDRRKILHDIPVLIVEYLAAFMGGFPVNDYNTGYFPVEHEEFIVSGNDVLSFLVPEELLHQEFLTGIRRDL